MNYCEKIRYNIYTTEVADFTTMADTLLAAITERRVHIQTGILRYSGKQ